MKESYESESFIVNLALPESMEVKNITLSSCSTPIDKERNVYRRGRGEVRHILIIYDYYPSN